MGNCGKQHFTLGEENFSVQLLKGGHIGRLRPSQKNQKLHTNVNFAIKTVNFTLAYTVTRATVQSTHKVQSMVGPINGWKPTKAFDRD